MYVPFEPKGGFQPYLADRCRRFRHAYRRCLGSLPSICYCQIGRMGILRPLIGPLLAIIGYKDNTQSQRFDDPLRRRLLTGENFTDRCSSMPAFADHATTPPARFT